MVNAQPASQCCLLQENARVGSSPRAGVPDARAQGRQWRRRRNRLELAVRHARHGSHHARHRRLRPHADPRRGRRRALAARPRRAIARRRRRRVVVARRSHLAVVVRVVRDDDPDREGLMDTRGATAGNASFVCHNCVDGRHVCIAWLSKASTSAGLSCLTIL